MPGTQRDLTTRIRREILQLLVLGLVAIVSFVATRAVAARSSRLSAADAAEWHARGEGALAGGDTAAALAAFRRAAGKNRGNRTYALALARALEAAGDAPAAERALLTLREAAPEDAEVNVELARLEAARQDVPPAVRYYRNALYAPSAAADPVMRRAVRLELIRLLLAREDRPRALGELVAAAADSANDVASAVELGRLFLQAGDDRRAADQFGRALRLDAHNAAALDGAGIAAFHLARYRDARRYLAAADSRDADARELRELADLVIQSDPLAPGVGAAERQRRLLAALQAARQHLDACAGTDAARALVQEIDASSAGVRRARRADPDALDAGVDLVGRAEQTADSCGTPSPLDRALALVARVHAADR